MYNYIMPMLSGNGDSVQQNLNPNGHPQHKIPELHVEHLAQHAKNFSGNRILRQVALEHEAVLRLLPSSSGRAARAREAGRQDRREERRQEGRKKKNQEMGLSCTLAWTGCDPRRPLCARFSPVNVSRDAAGPDVEPTDRRRLDLIVYGTTPAGLALCCDATLMSPLTLDRALLAQLCAPGLGRKTLRAQLALLQQPHAGAWLHAPPSKVLCLHVDGALFETMVRLRFRLAVADSDGPCLLCNGVADNFGDQEATARRGATASATS